MKLYTSCIYNESVVRERGLEMFDITVKTGDKDFSPAWCDLIAYQQSDKGV